jgi:hypothetical protein
MKTATVIRFDVVAVRIEAPHTVRLLDTNKTEAAAEGVVKFAVYRRGVETEFYAAVPAGKYIDGDTWEG